MWRPSAFVASKVEQPGGCVPGRWLGRLEYSFCILKFLSIRNAFGGQCSQGSSFPPAGSLCERQIIMSADNVYPASHPPLILDPDEQAATQLPSRPSEGVFKTGSAIFTLVGTWP